MNITAFLDYASKKYYEGSPILTDDEFDLLAEENNYSKVGHHLDNGIPHLVQLKSLQKVFEGEEPPIADTYATTKLDGAAVALIYSQQRLMRGLSRGDGKIGHDITDNVKHLVPPSISSFNIKQIVGEVVAPIEIANARNYAAGALNLKDEEEFKSRELKFIAYGIYPYCDTTWSADMAQLRSEGFATVIDNPWTEYPSDGKVYRIDNYAAFDRLGETSHHPKGAYALKKIPEGIKTKLLDVTWQVGKSGVVSPVAILEPVDIEGATISRATLHNMKYIDELNLEIGCDVEVIRSGDIIPRVVRRV